MGRRLMLAATVGLLPCVGCAGATGGATIDFPVAAAGAAGAIAGQPLACGDDGAGWEIVLAQATLHVGAIYLDQSAPISGGQATGCYLTGTYVAQETSPLDLDLLSPEPQFFSARAHGITDPPALIGQVWLTHGDVNAVVDAQPVLTVTGTAARGAAGTSRPFTASISIGANRQAAGTAAAAGGSPICKQRIVSPIAGVPPIQSTGGLLLRVDACLFFNHVDFGSLVSDPASGALLFSDDPSVDDSAGSADLYANLRSTAAYRFSWINQPTKE